MACMHNPNQPVGTYSRVDVAKVQALTDHPACTAQFILIRLLKELFGQLYITLPWDQSCTLGHCAFCRQPYTFVMLLDYCVA